MLDFVCIGAQKAATTWLFNALSMHPGVYFPLGKESNAWLVDPEEGPREQILYDYFISRFQGGHKDTGSTYKCGDICPRYATMDKQKMLRIYDRFPQVKTIYLVRNPVDRAWSALKMTAIKKGLDLDQMPNDEIKRTCTESTFAHGNYIDNILRWRNIAERYDAPPPLVLVFERVVSRPLEALSTICNHIGIDHRFFEQIPAQFIAQRVFGGTDKPLDPDLYKECLQQYEPSIRRLEQYLEDRLVEWGHCSSKLGGHGLRGARRVIESVVRKLARWRA